MLTWYTPDSEAAAKDEELHNVDAPTSDLLAELDHIDQLADDPDVPWIYRTARANQRRHRRRVILLAELHKRGYFNQETNQ